MLRRLFVACVAGLLLAGSAEVIAKGGAKPGRTILTAILSRSAVAPAAGKAKAKYDESKSRTNFEAEGENLRALNGKTAVVSVNGTVVGSGPITLGRFNVELSTQQGDQVPTLTAGVALSVSVDGIVIFSGALR
jgi:nucleoid-associated protein YgaU